MKIQYIFFKLWQNDFQSFCFLNKLRIIYGLALQKTSDWSLWKHTFKLFFSGYNYEKNIINKLYFYEDSIYFFYQIVCFWRHWILLIFNNDLNTCYLHLYYISNFEIHFARPWWWKALAKWFSGKMNFKVRYII
jgi:hypothetical protein